MASDSVPIEKLESRVELSSNDSNWPNTLPTQTTHVTFVQYRPMSFNLFGLGKATRLMILGRILPILEPRRVISEYVCYSISCPLNARPQPCLRHVTPSLSWIFLFLDLQLFLEPLASSLDRLVHLLRLGALSLTSRLLAAGLSANNLGHSSRPLLSRDTLG